jgi:hypothetical protein
MHAQPHTRVILYILLLLRNILGPTGLEQRHDLPMFLFALVVQIL